MHVLLVDDDPRLRQVLARLLLTSGFDTVDQAADGQEAIDLLSHTHPDLVLTDCQMPRLDGIALVRQMRAHGDQTPVIMFSGHSDPHIIVTAIRAGVNNYVPKPINAQALLEKIHETLDPLHIPA